MYSLLSLMVILGHHFVTILLAKMLIWTPFSQSTFTFSFCINPRQKHLTYMTDMLPGPRSFAKLSILGVCRAPARLCVTFPFGEMATYWLQFRAFFEFLIGFDVFDNVIAKPYVNLDFSVIRAKVRNERVIYF